MGVSDGGSRLEELSDLRDAFLAERLVVHEVRRRSVLADADLPASGFQRRGAGR